MEIERLNELMFEAEAHRDCEGVPWDKFLGQVLAYDFALRRSAASKPLEDRDGFLRTTRDAQPLERTMGNEPNDHVDPKQLSVLTRRYLRDAFREVAAVQKSLST
jgi:hypothetical protein